ncbi:exported hypothetical protein [Arthrobacter sp. 9AX]|uniref:hypothetical protein n=1 Tax=Arthrobacter sp. 9AX TaxID=2653131 RepID=UPI0012F15926|nr:exported hypothetical protein [Arthrobacter sp. 9AX]
MFVKSTLAAVAAVAAVAVLASLAGTAIAPAQAQAEASKPAPVVVGQPLAGTDAHNDYEHDRPLFDALEHGFTSVEADVWLVDGELRVAHDLADAKQGVTLESLYLDPLQVDGSNDATNYVRFTVAGNGAQGGDILSWEKVPFSS